MDTSPSRLLLPSHDLGVCFVFVFAELLSVDFGLDRLD